MPQTPSEVRKEKLPSIFPKIKAMRMSISKIPVWGFPVQNMKPYSSPVIPPVNEAGRSEEHTSELQSLMRISYDVFCLKKKNKKHKHKKKEHMKQKKEHSTYTSRHNNNRRQYKLTDTGYTQRQYNITLTTNTIKHT